MRKVSRRATAAQSSSGGLAVPYASPTAWSTSERRRYGKPSLSAKALFFSGASKEMPTMTALAASNCGVRSRNPWPSIVQPGVDAAGYHQSTTQRPAKSARETELPS
jgi:hypothetical protein